MNTLLLLIKRNIKLFFKDKGMFFPLSSPRRSYFSYTFHFWEIFTVTYLPPLCRPCRPSPIK